MRIDGQLSTATREAELQGMDFEDVVAEQAEEKALRERYGVPDPNWAMLQQRGGAEHASDRESREPQR
jgi:capsid protein